MARGFEWLEDEVFTMQDPELTGGLYFPLANEAGVKSSITPDLGGDCKLSQNIFLLPPVSGENLHNDKSSRNVWVRIDGKPWSATGRSSAQQATLFSDEREETKMTAGFLWQELCRTSKVHGISAKIESFVPCDDVTLELHRITIQNSGDSPKDVQPVVALPLYARSADNLRDHRHVTSLLHRIETTENGVVVEPTLTFDERGHQKNHLAYGVFAASNLGDPIGFFPTVQEWIGEGGNLENPQALYQPELTGRPAKSHVDGYEALGGILFPQRTLMPGECWQVIAVLGVGKGKAALSEMAKPYLEDRAFSHSLATTKAYWKERVNVRLETADNQFDRWMRWVGIQPMLRRIYGCSFLPHHDYGKGGRGWRDLWQDCLALLLMNPDGVREMLINNFGGVRMDGTNATIIGALPGEFIADRNNIARVWMDHGVWPLLTTDLYIQQTGDSGVLLQKTSYFRDRHICRCAQNDEAWTPQAKNRQTTAGGDVYHGTLLEHLLIQALTSFYDVGEHNHIRLCGADWNDALDLADERGESVAFTTMYAYNLQRLGELLEHLGEEGMGEVSLAGILSILLESSAMVSGAVSEKRQILKRYLAACNESFGGDQKVFSTQALAEKLFEMAEWMRGHIRESEWITDHAGHSWYNSYYDNSGRRVEGDHPLGTRMMLTGQVFSLFSGTATDEQLPKVIDAVDHYLYDPTVGGYRLNTNFHEVKMDLGRMFGFAYGHKENGAVFSHMAVMYQNALYRRGAARAGHKVLRALFSHCNDFSRARIFPGVPEYIDQGGRGMYPYLTGAASWLLYTMVTEVFGVRGRWGDLTFVPQLLREEFDEAGHAAIELCFAGRALRIEYHNPQKLDAGEYVVRKLCLNQAENGEGQTYLTRKQLLALDENQKHTILITLGAI